MSKKRKKNNKSFKEVLKGMNAKRLSVESHRATASQAAYDRRRSVITRDRKMIENPSSIYAPTSDIYGVSKIIQSLISEKDPWSKEQRQRLLESNVIYLTLPLFKVAFVTSIIRGAIEPAVDKIEVNKAAIINEINESDLFDSVERADLDLFLRNLDSVTILRKYNDEEFEKAKERILLDIEIFLRGGVLSYYASKPHNIFQDLDKMEIPQSKAFMGYLISRYSRYAGYIDIDKFNKALLDGALDKSQMKEMISPNRMLMLELWKEHHDGMTKLPPIDLSNPMKEGK